MTLPNWTKPGIYGAIVGGLLVALVGFSWGGWVTGSGANKMAENMAHDEVMSAMVPVCLEMSREDPERTEKMTAIRDSVGYNRREAVMASGWATMPGSEKPNRDLAQECLKELDVT
jgi:hypothetical protein